MPDLNKLLTEIADESKDLKIKLGQLYEKYEDLYREGNRLLISERSASAGSMEGLEEFRRLILLVKRNRDVVSSLTRGVSNLRTISNFKFVEEEIPVPTPKRTKKSISKEIIEQKSIIEVIEPKPIVAEDN